jgi:quinol monooxygenase YgiN
MGPLKEERNMPIPALALSLVVVLAGALAVGCAGPVPSGEACRPEPPKSVLRHVVLFKFKDGAPAEKVREIESRFGKLKTEIPGIIGYEWGTDVSPEKLAQGFTHCFLVTFPDAAARDAYLPHPAHQAFVAVLKPHLDKVLVVDYVSKP